MTFQIALIAEWPNTSYRNTDAPHSVYAGASSGHPYQWMTSDKCDRNVDATHYVIAYVSSNYP